MSVLCKMFGHKPEPWYHLQAHPNIAAPYYDGILGAHRDLTVECKRCGTRYVMGKVIDPILSGPAGDAFVSQYQRRQKAVR